MLGRYTVELLLVLLCGMGIHADEVVRLGGSEALVHFNKVSAAPNAYFAFLDTTGEHL